MRIYVIGFMGSGKTTIAHQLAGYIGFHAIDLDQVIMQQEGQGIEGIFLSKGEDYFRKVEKDILRSTVLYENTVIATGGGTPCYFDNMRFMCREGYTIYLRLTPELLWKRLKTAAGTRPLISHLTPASLKQYISETLVDRSPYYEAAEYIVDIGEGNHVEDVVTGIIPQIRAVIH